MQRFRHLREADSADVGERLEESRQRAPRDRARRVDERSIGADLVQGAFDLNAALEHRSDLGRGDTGTAAVRQPEVARVERCASDGVAGLGARGGGEERKRELDRIPDLDALTQDDRAHAHCDPNSGRWPWL
jgi:hypothetical protein